MLGLDCEFYSENCTEFGDQMLALMQIASVNKAWIIDCIDLVNDEGFKGFFKDLMGNEKVLKIGHTFSGDINVFQDTFKTKVDKVAGLVDI